MEMHTLSDQDADRTISLSAGDSIRIELEEPSTTGYRWAVDSADPSVLDPVSTGMAPHAGVGAGGLRTFEFAAKAPGRAPLRLKLWREWEGDRSVIRRFQVDLDIRP